MVLGDVDDQALRGQEAHRDDGLLTACSCLLYTSIRYPLTYTELLGMRLAHEAAAAGDWARVADLEAVMAAAKVPDRCV